jgi:DTW domain-containing protein YfiP
VACLCRHLDGPRIHNRTGVTILQHPRERFHPLGTARLVELGLARVRLRVAFGLVAEPELPEGTALLYPLAGAPALDAVAASEQPRHLLLLDGTWANARRLHRANSWLAGLPCFRLSPPEPGRYRIRGEPDDQSLSTVEAVVQALRILEPETEGLDRLLAAFEAMIDGQVRLAESGEGGPRRRLRRRQPRPVPGVLVERRDAIVVVYGESAPGPAGGRRLVQWSAHRPASGETFERLLRPGDPPPQPRHLAHMGLTLADLERRGIEEERLEREWRAFRGRGAVLVAWNRSTLDLIAHDGPAVPLKAAYCNLERLARGQYGSLEETARREGLIPVPTPLSGRAATRVGLALAMLEHLQQQVRVR